MIYRYTLSLLALILLSLMPVQLQAQYWQRANLPGTYAATFYLDVYFLPGNAQYGWVCGYNGHVVRTTDGGTTWQGATVPFSGRAAGHLESVQFVDTQTGYASGPCGFFKSTDGGASWTDITPSIPNFQTPWGMYFLNSSYGVVLAGGCVSYQYFLRTTNGGTTWTTYIDSVANSGLTDVLLYPNGTGYAASSGKIWQTADSGATWSVAATSGPNYWNEELAAFGSSFLVPVAGTTCQGAGSGGGARFSTDNGANWNSFNTSGPNYGVFLLSATSGWLCGANRGVWFTSNAGQSWEYRGCGTDGDLDDIWFINDTTGWVAGNGVYRYSAPQRTASKASINFGVLCPPLTKQDTFWVRNRSWFGTQAQWTLIGADLANFGVLQPGVTFNIPACDSVMVIVRFDPKSGGVKNATLRVDFPSAGTHVDVSLTGDRRGSTSVPNDTLVQILAADCGVPLQLNSVWNNSSTNTDQITQIQRVSGDASIIAGFNTPINIPPGGVTVPFGVTLADTGWVSARFRMRVSPCDRDTFITFRAYGISPIITAPSIRIMQSKCYAEVIDSIPITNTGNADLIIDRAGFSAGSPDISIVGWSNNEQLPITIKRGEVKYIYIRFAPKAGGVRNVTLRLMNNDKTTIRGLKNPYDINIEGRSEAPEIKIDQKQIEFGEVCVGSTIQRGATITNKGVVTISIEAPTFMSSNTVFTATIEGSAFPAQILSGADGNLTIRFTPNRVGEFVDTLYAVCMPCSLHFAIPLHGWGITTQIATNPTSINTFIKAKQTTTIDVEVSSTGSADAIISNITLVPARSDWRLINTLSLPYTLAPGNKVSVTVEFTPQTDDTQYSGQLCFDVSGKCPTSACVPITVQTINSSITFSKTAIDFGVVKCTPRQQQDTIVIRNEGTDADELIMAEIQSSLPHSFDLLSPLSLPVSIDKNGNILLIVRSGLQTEGVDTARLVIKFKTAFGAKEISFPLRAEFRKAASSLAESLKDFGVVEPCSPPQRFVMHFSNAGTLDDDFNRVYAGTLDGLSFQNDANLKLRALSSDSLEVIFTPSTIQLNPGDERIIDGSITYTSKVCGDVLRILFKAKVVRPRLTITPTQLAYSLVWKGGNKTLYVGVKNNTTYTRTITAINFANNKAENFAYTLSLPHIMNAGDSLSIPITFTAVSEGDYATAISIREESVCVDSTAVTMTANVPLEAYRAVLRMGDTTSIYTVAVSDTTTIPFVLTTDENSDQALWKSQPSSIVATLKYDNAVMNVLSAYAIKDGVEIPLNYTADGGSLRVTVPQSASAKLGSSGTLFLLRVQGMQSVPSYTEVRITNATAETLKDAVIDTEHGVFNVLACVKWARIKLSETFALRVGEQPAHDLINIDVNSSGEQTLSLRVVNLLGNDVGLVKCEAHEGNLRLSILTQEMASGSYVIVASNQTGYTQRIKVVIEK